MGQWIQPITTDEFKIRIGSPENVGLLTDAIDRTTCVVVVNYDFSPTAIKSQCRRPTIHCRDAKSVEIPLCQGKGSTDTRTTGAPSRFTVRTSLTIVQFVW